MMTSIIFIFIWIVFSHWVSDFIFQAEEWAVNKSTSFKALINHTLTYSIIMTIFWACLIKDPLNIAFFFGLTLATHTLTDFFTSKLVKTKFDNKEFGSKIPNFGAFTIIGFDQVIHYVTIIYTLHYIGLI